MELNTLWFVLALILVTGYLILDGFDFGVGILQFFFHKERDKRVLFESISPVWNGNELWLIFAIMLLFFIFPKAYVALSSSFYIPCITFFVVLVFRAIFVTLWQKKISQRWKHFLEIAFGASSLICSLIIGLVLGNIYRGLILNTDFVYAGRFYQMINPYSLIASMTFFSLILLHGNLYLILNCKGKMQAKIKDWVSPICGTFLICLALLTLVSFVKIPHIHKMVFLKKWVLAPYLLIIFCLFKILFATERKEYLKAFAFSILNIVTFMLTIGMLLYPYLVITIPNPIRSLTIYNAAASESLLKKAILAALILLPLLFTYTTYMHKKLWEKSKVDKAPH